MNSNPHLNHLLERAPALSSCLEEIEKAYEVMRHSFAMKGKLLLCGNGGSAADAMHLAEEMIGKFLRDRRPLPATSPNPQ